MFEKIVFDGTKRMIARAGTNYSVEKYQVHFYKGDEKITTYINYTEAKLLFVMMKKHGGIAEHSDLMPGMEALVPRYIYRLRQRLKAIPDIETGSMIKNIVGSGYQIDVNSVEFINPNEFTESDKALNIM